MIRLCGQSREGVPTRLPWWLASIYPAATRVPGTSAARLRWARVDAAEWHPHEQEDIMRRIYAAIAWIIAGGVVVQAASIAFALGGIGRYVQDGGVIDKALVESRQATFIGDLGFPIHGIVGGMVIPLAAVALLIVAFFVKADGARLRGARLWAAVVLALVALQITLGYSIVDMPYLGLVHGANALAVLLTAVYAGMRARRSAAAGAEERASHAIAT